MRSMPLPVRRKVFGIGVPVTLAVLTALTIGLLGPRPDLLPGRLPGMPPEPAIAAPATSATPSPDAVSPAAAAAAAAWLRDGGKRRHDALLAAATAVITRATSGRSAGLGALCRRLGAEVTAARAYRPVPDELAQDKWVALLYGMTQASDDCQNYLVNTYLPEQEKLDMSAGECERAVEVGGAFTERIAKLTGAPPR